MNDDAERTMRDELANALGEPVSAEEAHEALERPAPGLARWLREQQLMIAIGACVALVVGALLAVTVGSWWVLGAALLVHAIATLVIGYVALRVTTNVEKPDPVTVARLQDEGVDDPESKLNMAIQAHNGNGDADPVAEAFRTPAEERGRGADEQVAITPSSEETELTGPSSRNGRMSPRG